MKVYENDVFIHQVRSEITGVIQQGIRYDETLCSHETPHCGVEMSGRPASPAWLAEAVGGGEWGGDIASSPGWRGDV